MRFARSLRGPALFTGSLAALARCALACCALACCALGCGDLELTSGAGGSTSSAVTGTSATSTGTTMMTGAGGATVTAGAGGGGGGGGVFEPKIFLILMENHTWATFKDSPSAPFINAMIAEGAYAEHYYNPPGLHPSEPNYIWLEAGTNFGIKDDKDPAFNHKASKDHLVTLLEGAGRTWKSYQEGISGLDCPLVSVKKYAPKHNPMVFFDDVTDTNSTFAIRCITHVRPFHEIDQDLVEDHVADYNFLTPDLCNDGHNLCAPQFDRVRQSDDWLAVQIPKIRASKAYARGAIILVTWDEGENNLDGPLGMIALGRSAKVGYKNQIPYTHSSTLRTVQTFLGVMPLLGDAANATDLGDLFEPLKLH